MNSARLVQRRSTSNDIDQLVGNDGLSGSVVQNGVGSDHVTGVLRSIVHGVSSGRNLRSVTLSLGSQKRVGQRKLGQSLRGLLVLQLVLAQTWSLLDGVGGENRELRWLERNTGNELVVQDFGVLVFAQGGDLIGDQGNLVEGRLGLTNTAESQLQLLGVGSVQLDLSLVTNGDNVNVSVQLTNSLSGGLGDLSVDRTTQTLVGGNNNQQGLVGSSLFWLSVLEELSVGLVEDSGGLHGSLGLVQSGGGNNLHGLGDLLDVLNGLKTHLDFSQSGIVSCASTGNLSSGT